MTIYRFFILLHVLSAFTFLMAHGASAYAIFMVRKERDRDRICFWLDLSRLGVKPALISLATLLLTGIIMTIWAGWWRYGWVWTSLALLFAIGYGMGRYASSYMSNLRLALGAPVKNKVKSAEGELIPQTSGPISQSALEALVKTGKPKLVASIGLGGLSLILMLMLFKPF